MNPFKEIVYNCRNTTFLIEKKDLKKLTFRETIELRIHLAGCSLCRLYVKQSDLIGLAITSLLKKKPELPLDEGFKEELQSKINDQLNKN